MDLQNEKCVMVIDEHLPLGIIANTAAIMGITLGKKMPEVVGADVTDKTGNEHLGIIETICNDPAFVISWIYLYTGDCKNQW